MFSKDYSEGGCLYPMYGYGKIICFIIFFCFYYSLKWHYKVLMDFLASHYNPQLSRDILGIFSFVGGVNVTMHLHFVNFFSQVNRSRYWMGTYHHSTNPNNPCPHYSLYSFILPPWSVPLHIYLVSSTTPAPASNFSSLCTQDSLQDCMKTLMNRIFLPQLDHTLPLPLLAHVSIYFYLLFPLPICLLFSYSCYGFIFLPSIIFTQWSKYIYWNTENIILPDRFPLVNYTATKLQISCSLVSRL